MLTILHGSDLHFGKPFDAEVADVFLGSIQEISPDLIVLSGDFTQRAKVREFRAARDFLRKLPDLPLVLTPGNHDVPLYRVWERVLTPLRNYQNFISPELDTVTSIEGATVVSLNSTAPRRAVVNGRVGDGQLLFAARAFGNAPGKDLRVVVLHHHLTPAPDYESDQVLPGFQMCLEAFAKMRVELILGGHLHRAYVSDSLDAYSGLEGYQRMVIAHSGTTTSTRGRARERKKNSFNLIGVSGYHIVVTHHQYFREDRRFAPVRTHTFPRGTEAALGMDPMGGIHPGRTGPTGVGGGNQ